MTVGRPGGTPEGPKGSHEIFPPISSSSDTEKEDEMSGEGLVLPRAGKLDEFLSPEEETDSTDSNESFIKTLRALKQKGKWDLLEFLLQSDPENDEKESEDEENLDSFFQHKNRGKPQVQDPQSLKCGPTRRGSSLSSLPSSDTPRAQALPTSDSGPRPRQRSVCSWASSITIPQPFRMTLREARKKSQWLSSAASFEQERLQAQRQCQEEAECHRQFRAQPVPAHVYLPLYQEMMECRETQRHAGIQKRKELLLSSLKPFSFLEKEEQRQKEAVAQQKDLAAMPKAKVPQKKAIRKSPRSILEPAFGEKLQEAEILRKIRIQMRALDMLQMASSPIKSFRSQAPRTATRTWEEKLSFLRTDFVFQPHVNSVVPDHDGLYKAFQKRAAKRRETREATRNKPFLLRTANLSHTPRSCDAASTEGRRKSPQAAATPLPRSRSLSGLASLSANTLPVHISDATRRRESAVKASLEKKNKSDRSTQWLETQKRNCQAISKSVTFRAKAMDPHKSLEEVLKAKVKENRKNDHKRTREYKKELEEMKKRIQTRPYLFEQVTKDHARKEAEQWYRDKLKQAGLQEEFVTNKSQSTQAVPWKEIHETTKHSMRDLWQDLEESLKLPANPKKELEEL